MHDYMVPWALLALGTKNKKRSKTGLSEVISALNYGVSGISVYCPFSYNCKMADCCCPCAPSVIFFGLPLLYVSGQQRFFAWFICVMKCFRFMNPLCFCTILILLWIKEAIHEGFQCSSCRI